MARNIFVACDGDIDRAMKHDKMPYKKRSTVMRLARENDWYSQVKTPEPRSGKLTEEEIETIRKAFMETGGYIGKTAQRTGFGKATVSRYAKARNWHQQLLKSSKQELEEGVQKKDPVNDARQSDEALVDDKNDKTTEELKAVRQMLLDQISGRDSSELENRPALKIAPKTLSEAIKALIDIDKRIADRENEQPLTELDPYQKIVVQCAKTGEDEPKEEDKKDKE